MYKRFYEYFVILEIALFSGIYIFKSEASFVQDHSIPSKGQKPELSVRLMGRSVAQCFGQSEILNCVENQILTVIDNAIENNDTWHLRDYVVFEKSNHASKTNMESHPNQRNQRSFGDNLATKLMRLAQTRSVKLKLSDKVSNVFDQRGISGALDEFLATTISSATGLSAVATTNSSSSSNSAQDEGRKKKDKDKNMAMMGGMAMMAMVAQMFLGKVILIAGAAFIMAKIALLVALLGSLKKGSNSSSGNTEHVIVTTKGGGGGGGSGGGGGGHGGGHDSGWHRSMPYKHYHQPAVVADEHRYIEPPSSPTYYEIAEEDEFKRRQIPAVY